jgi:diketogulonate reductase-like aldo/keto reductase
VLRWHVQSGYIAIPGSKNPDHIAENISIFDFELTDDEMKQIASLNTGLRYENW